MTNRAVLTGDLIGSSRLSDASLQAARSTVIEATDQLPRWGKGLLGSQPEFFRGDGWQVLLMDPGYFLRAALLIRARLRAANESWDTRISVGIGQVSRIDKSRTSLSSGEAFLLSGQALDRMAVGSKIAVSTPQPHVSKPGRAWPMLEPLAQLCSAIVDDWTSKQAEVAALAIIPDAPTQAEIAERLKITQQAVSKALSSAKLGVILQACAKLESLSWTLTRHI